MTCPEDDWGDALPEEYGPLGALEYHEDEEYEAHFDYLYGEAIRDFKEECLKSYFSDHPDLTEGSDRALARARELLSQKQATASFIFASIALELTVKNCLFRPILHGLVHNEYLASLLVDYLCERPQFGDGLGKLLLRMLNTYGGVELTSYKRHNAKQCLWAEIKKNRTHRNRVIHEGQDASDEEAREVIALAETVLGDVLGRVLKARGLQLDPERRIRHLPQSHFQRDWIGGGLDADETPEEPEEDD